MSNPNSSCEEPDGLASRIIKRKRNPPGHPDPDAKVIALSPRTLMATNRFVCEICSKGFQRDQNLQLHRRGHNLPWRLKQKASQEAKKVYVCPEESCVHHDPARALGDLTGIKKHFSRKHGEKKWKCGKCDKHYAVLSDWKAHQKTCGTREYRCDCGTLFSRRDSFSTHRAFCDALAEESTKIYMLRHTETSHEAAGDSNCGAASFIGDLSTAMKASSSPTSQITRDAFTYTDVSKPPFTNKRAWNLTSPEGTTASAWMPGHGGIRPTVALSKSPGLSLYLGMGPGPGPPGCSSDLSGTSGSPFDFPSLETLQQLAFPHAASTQGYGTHMQSSSASIASSMGMLSSIFSSPKPAYLRHETRNDMSGILGYPDMNLLDEQAMRQVSADSSRVRSTSTNLISTIGGISGIQSKPSSHHAVSSATALLQKAAQMGATASSRPSLQLQRFGVGGMGETMNAQDMAHRQPSWPGPSSMLSSHYRHAGEARKDDGGAEGVPASASRATTCETVSGYGSMEEFMDSVSAGRSGLLGNAWVDHIPSSTGSVAVQKSAPSSLTAPEGMLHSLPREELSREAPMVDFLGVGRSSGMVGFFANCRNHGD